METSRYGSFFIAFFTTDTSAAAECGNILPDAARQEIMCGRLPQLKTDSIFTQKGEFIQYIDKGILLKDKTKKHYKSKRSGYSMPGLFKGDRIHFGGGSAEPVEEIITEQFKGILYVTNKRIIFVNKDSGFDKPYRTLSAVTPYSNGIELQYGSTTFCLLVPDGSVSNEENGVAHTCWNCQSAVSVPISPVIGKNRILISADTKLYSHHVVGDCDMTTVVGEVVQNPRKISI